MPPLSSRSSRTWRDPENVKGDSRMTCWVQGSDRYGCGVFWGYWEGALTSGESAVILKLFHN